MNTVVKRIEKWEDIDSVETIYKLIRRKEYSMGEDFIDQYESIVNDMPFVTYLFGKGIITKEILNSFISENFASLQSFLGGYDEPYCLFPYGECEEESNFKKYHVLAEYINNIDALKQRLFNVLKNRGYDGDCMNHEEKYGEYELVLTKMDYTETENHFGTIHDEWFWVNNHSIEDVNKILSKRRQE